MMTFSEAIKETREQLNLPAGRNVRERELLQFAEQLGVPVNPHELDRTDINVLISTMGRAVMEQEELEDRPRRFRRRRA